MIVCQWFAYFLLKISRISQLLNEASIIQQRTSTKTSISWWSEIPRVSKMTGIYWDVKKRTKKNNPSVQQSLGDTAEGWCPHIYRCTDLLRTCDPLGFGRFLLELVHCWREDTGGNEKDLCSSQICQQCQLQQQPWRRRGDFVRPRCIGGRVQTGPWAYRPGVVVYVTANHLHGGRRCYASAFQCAQCLKCPHAVCFSV